MWLGDPPSPAGRVADVDVTDGGISFAGSDALGDVGPPRSRSSANLA